MEEWGHQQLTTKSKKAPEHACMCVLQWLGDGVTRTFSPGKVQGTEVFCSGWQTRMSAPSMLDWAKSKGQSQSMEHEDRFVMMMQAEP